MVVADLGRAEALMRAVAFGRREVVIRVETPAPDLAAAVERGRILGEATNFARLMANEPGNAWSCGRNGAAASSRARSATVFSPNGTGPAGLTPAFIAPAVPRASAFPPGSSDTNGQHSPANSTSRRCTRSPQSRGIE